QHESAAPCDRRREDVRQLLLHLPDFTSSQPPFFHPQLAAADDGQTGVGILFGEFCESPCQIVDPLLGPDRPCEQKKDIAVLESEHPAYAFSFFLALLRRKGF